MRYTSKLTSTSQQSEYTTNRKTVINVSRKVIEHMLCRQLILCAGEVYSMQEQDISS